MKKNSLQIDRKLIARKRAETRLKIYGIMSISIALIMLSTLIISIGLSGYSALQQAYVKLDINVESKNVLDENGEFSNKKAPTRPGKAAGNTTFKVVSALVAPSPKEPSLKDCGTELIISSDNDDINGIIIIPITAPAAKADSELTSSPSDIPTFLKNGAAVKAAK